jgi:hypothetical protein
VGLILAPFVAVALVASAGAGFAAGLAQPDPAQPRGTGWFDRWVSDASDVAWSEGAATMADHQLRKQGRAALGSPKGSLEGVPFTSFQVRLARAGRPDGAQARTGRFEAKAIIEYELPVDGVTVGRTADHEPVRLDRTGKVLVVGPRGDARVDGLGAIAEDARRDVAAFWSAKWPGTAVVVLPSEARLLDPLVGTPAGSDQVAVTLWSTGSDGPVIRVMMNPSVYNRMLPLAREIVLRHEITHVAQDALPRDNVPTWLTEGLADYVGYRGSGVPDFLVGRELFAQVQASGPPDRLPAESEFALDRAGDERRVAYQAGWAFCQMIVDEYGEGQLVPFYAAVARGDGSSQQRLDDAADEVLGASFDELLVKWQAWLRANA